MSHLFSHRWIIILLAICFVPLAASAEVPDPSQASQMYPDSRKAGPPPTIKPGTRLVFFGGAATIPGVRSKLVPDENGNWVNKTTGQKFAATDVQGSGGVGFTIARVSHVDREAVAINTTSYLFDPLNKTVSYTGGSGMVTNAGAAADYWVHPAVLKNIQPLNQGGVFIGQVPYVLGNRKFNAIRFQTESASGHTAYVYDLDTGILLFYGASAIGGDVLTPGVNGQQAGVGAGSTHLSHNMLVEVKDIDLPWKDAPVPAWVNQFRELRYDGSIVTAIQGVQPMTQPMSIVMVPKARENGWLRLSSTVTTQVYGFPPTQSKNDGAAGAASLNGLWIAPQALAKLQLNQVIETNEHLKTKTLVTDIGRGYVTISEIGQLHRIDVGYDTNTGIMAGVTLKQQNQISLTTTQVRLSGQK